MLVKAMDIASGFLRLPCRSYYPSFSKTLSFDAHQLGVGFPALPKIIFN